MIQYLTGIPTGIMVFIINVPLFIYGFNKVDRKFALYGGLSMMVFSLLLNITKDIGSIINIQDVFIGAIVGGILNGTGVGLLFKNRMCQDGLDIIATDINRKYNIRIGTSLLIVNSIIVIISSLIFDLRLAIYTVIAIYINSTTLDRIRVGFNVSKSVFIISDEGKAIADEIREGLGRSVTFLEGMGSYKEQEKMIIYLVVTRSEIVKLKNIVDTIDPLAFTTISSVVEVKGGSFTDLNI